MGDAELPVSVGLQTVMMSVRGELGRDCLAHPDEKARAGEGHEDADGVEDWQGL